MTLAVYPQLVNTHNAAYVTEQADLSTAEGAANCACAGGAGLANWGHAQGSLVTHHAFRLAAGNPTISGAPAGLSSSAVRQALVDYNCVATRYWGSDITIAKNALIAGKAVGFCLDYATINGYASGKYSGDRNFMGGHFVVCFDWDVVSGVNKTKDWDSLLDGRPKSAYVILNAPQWVPFKMIRLAAGRFRVNPTTSSYSSGTPIGTDKGVFIVVDPI